MTRYRIVEGELGAVEVDGQQFGRGRLQILEVRRDFEPLVIGEPRCPQPHQLSVELRMRLELLPGDHVEIQRHAWDGPVAETFDVPQGRLVPIQTFLAERIEQDLLRDWHLPNCQKLRAVPNDPLFGGPMSCNCDLRAWMYQWYQTRKKLLELHRQYPDSPKPPAPGLCSACSCPRAMKHYPCSGVVRYPCDTLKILAAPYDWHPEFDPAWRLT